MLPGLIDGDFILVNKFSYGLRMPLLNSLLVPTGDPRRGDVIVFRSPSDPDTNLIKRLIGLPGDHVLVKNNRLFVNGALMPLTPDGLYAGGFGFTGSPLAKEKFDDAEHILLLASGRYAKDFDGVVPAGHYFFMGDNRNDSEDSRFPDVGFVPRENLIGHAIRIWMNWQLPGWPKLGRVGMRIQ
jgi:signal peptidase I